MLHVLGLECLSNILFDHASAPSGGGLKTFGNISWNHWGVFTHPSVLTENQLIGTELPDWFYIYFPKNWPFVFVC